jgi:hypothetical protein
MNKGIRILAWVLGCAAAAWAQAADYVVLTQGQPAGHMRVQTLPTGGWKPTYSYRDNGRGPDMRESFTLDALGVPTRYQIEGKSTFGALVNESFSLEGGRARWKSHADQGDEAVPEGFVFMPLEATLAYADAMVRLLLSRPDASAPTHRRPEAGGAAAVAPVTARACRYRAAGAGGGDRRRRTALVLLGPRRRQQRLLCHDLARLVGGGKGLRGPGAGACWNAR